MSTVTLVGRVVPAVRLIDIGLTISYLQQVTIDLAVYESSVQAQTMVARGDLIIPGGPVDNPTFVPVEDVNPETFNINPQKVETEDLDSFLQAVVFQWGVLWSIDPHFVNSPSLSRIDFGNGEFHVQGGTYTITAGHLIATQNQVLIARLVGGQAILNYQPIDYIPGLNEVIMGSYDFTNKTLFLVGMIGVGAGGSIPATSVTYVPTAPIISTNVQGALDELAAAIGGSASFVAGDVLTPFPNGSNNVFQTTLVPATDKETIFYNGQALERGVGKDYTITGQTITFSFAPESAAVLTANYFYV